MIYKPPLKPLNHGSVSDKDIETTMFLNPNHDFCVAETGSLADKARPTAPDREYLILGS